MQQIRLLVSIILTICVLSVDAASPTALSFADTIWNFGRIKEVDGKVSHTFVCRNTSSEPVVIVDIAASCGCTVPEYSRKPILPGEQTSVKVTYDPQNRPGTFAKSLEVYGAGRALLAELQIKGNVIERERTIEELYPFDMGGGLRFDANYNAFSYIYQGRTSEGVIGYVNTLSHPISLSLTPVKRSGMLQIEAPKIIGAGERGKIFLRYNIVASSGLYGTIDDVLAVSVSGEKSRYPLSMHGVVVDNPDSMSDISAPEAVISQNIIKFGTLKRNGAKRHSSFVLENVGLAPLVVRKVECGYGLSCSLRAGQSVAADAKVQATVSITPSLADVGSYSAYVIVITSDPVRPVRRIRVTAMIVD